MVLAPGRRAGQAEGAAALGGGATLGPTPLPGVCARRGGGGLPLPGFSRQRRHPAIGRIGNERRPLAEIPVDNPDGTVIAGDFVERSRRRVRGGLGVIEKHRLEEVVSEGGVVAVSENLGRPLLERGDLLI